MNLLPWFFLVVLIAAIGGTIYLVRKNNDAQEVWGEARTLVTDSYTAFRGGELTKSEATDVSLGEFLRANVEDTGDYAPVMWPERVNVMTEKTARQASRAAARTAQLTGKAASRAKAKVVSLRKSA